MASSSFMKATISQGYQNPELRYLLLRLDNVNSGRIRFTPTSMFRGNIGIMEKRVETTISGIGFRP